jgi:hypothetical protein
MYAKKGITTFVPFFVCLMSLKAAFYYDSQESMNNFVRTEYTLSQLHFELYAKQIVA